MLVVVGQGALALSLPCATSLTGLVCCSSLHPAAFDPRVLDDSFPGTVNAKSLACSSLIRKIEE